MNQGRIALLILCLLPLILLFEPLFLDASLLSLDNKIIPPFCCHLTADDLPKVMNTASGDINAWLMPETMLQLERIKKGELPLWNECGHLGQPLMAMLGFTPFYPASLLYLALGPMRGFAVSMAFHLVLLGVGMWLFLRRLELENPAALLGAVSLSLCTFITVHMHIPQFVQVAAWLPWMLIAADRLIDQPDFRRAALFGITIGLCFLGGFPQLSLISLFTVAVYVLLGLVRRAKGKRRPATAFAAAAVVLGAMLSCLQLLPASEFLSESKRGEGWSAEVLRQKRFAPQSIVGLVLPRFFGPAVQEFTIDDLSVRYIWEFPSVKAWQETESQNGFEENAVFIGLIPLCLGLMSFVRKWRSREHLPRLIMIASLMFCMGLFFVSGWSRVVPGISTGSPKRALFIFSFALAWLASLELDRILKERRSAWLIPCGVGLAALGLACVMPFEQWLFSSASSEEQAWFRETLIPDLIRAAVAGSILVAAALAFRFEKIRIAVVLLLAGTAGELVLFGRYLNPPQPMRGQYQSTPVIDWLAENGAGRDKRIIHFSSPEVLPPSMVQVFGLRSCIGFGSMVDRETGELLCALEPAILNLQAPGLTDALKDVKSLQSPVLDMMGAHYVSTGALGYRQISEALDELPGIEFAYGEVKEGLAIYERKSALPPAVMVRRLRVIPDDGERLDYLVSGDFDPSVEAVVEHEIDGSQDLITGGAALLLRGARYDRPCPERIEVQVDGETPAFLVISESHYPGWHARVDGEIATLHRVNHALMGVMLPKGAKSVVLKYDPHSFYAGFGLSLLGVIFCIAFLLKRSNDAAS